MSPASDGSQRVTGQGLLRDGGPREAAGLIAEAVADLLQLARRHGLDMLEFLLDMAQMEAEERIRLSESNL